MALRPMLNITAEQIRKRREETGRGMMECKRELERERISLLLGTIPRRDPQLALIVDILKVLNERPA